MTHKLTEVSLMQLKENYTKDNQASFIVEPLSPGFGLTLGNAIRRVLLSSLPGAAITSIRIDGVAHEFSTIKGMTEDVVDLILNLKQVRFQLDNDEPQVVILDIKAPKKVTAADFKCPTGVRVINKNTVVAELVTGGKLLIEATVEKGRGYLPTEMRKEEKLPIGVISIDTVFSPIKRVNFEVENTRVGKMTNFDKLILEIETDGSVTPQVALAQSADILVDHFSVLADSIGSITTTKTEAAIPIADIDVSSVEPIVPAESDVPKLKKTSTKTKKVSKTKLVQKS